MGERAVVGKPPKFKGISQEVQEILEADMEKAPARRRAREAFKEVQLSIDFCLFKVLRLTSAIVHQNSQTCEIEPRVSLDLVVFIFDSSHGRASLRAHRLKPPPRSWSQLQNLQLLSTSVGQSIWSFAVTLIGPKIAYSRIGPGCARKLSRTPGLENKETCKIGSNFGLCLDLTF